MVEAGWYRVEGDPPGTKRRWNGEQWIGVPVLQPGATAPEAAPPAVQQLSTTGSVSAMLSIGGFLSLAIVMVSLIWRLDRAAETIPDNYLAVAGLSDLPKFVSGFWFHVLAIVALALLTSATFMAWLTDAVDATRAMTAAQMRRTGMGQGFGGYLLFVVVLMFGSVILVWWMMARWARSSSRARPASHRPNLFNILNLVIERVNGTNKRDVDPIRVLVWWVLLWVPIAVGICTWLWTLFFGQSNVDAMPQVVLIYEVLLGLSIVSLMAITSTVWAISQRLGDR